MSDPDDLPPLATLNVPAILAALTGVYPRPADTCHVDPRPTRPPPPPNSPDDLLPEETDPC